jgi:hypothetical protein
MKHLDFKDKLLRIDDKELEMEFSIKDARIIDNKAIVIFDFNDLASRYQSVLHQPRKFHIRRK